MSHIHREAVQKWVAQERPTVASQLNTQLQKLQAYRRIGLLMQLEGLRFLSCQAISIFGQREKQGNLFQLVKAWRLKNDELKEWMKESKYMHPEAVNEQLSIMGQTGQTLLRNLLAASKNVTCQPCFSLIADEAIYLLLTYLIDKFNCSVPQTSVIHKDSIAFFRVPDTKSETLYNYQRTYSRYICGKCGQSEHNKHSCQNI